jgi:hypothetical protein
MAQYSAPIQPMSGNVQENYRQMQEHVRQWNPNFPQPLIERSLNTRLRMIQDRRMWGGLLIRGQILTPATYSTGTVAVNHNSYLVTGSGTTWPVNDEVNTTLSSAITDVNILQDITPADMTNINAGDWVTISAGTASQEILLVISTASTTFRAKPTLTHLVSAPVTKSSYVRRQFRETTGKGQYYNVTSVVSPTQLYLDIPFGGGTLASTGYRILLAYISMGQDLRMVWSMVNHQNGWRIRLNLPAESLNNFDVWRTATGFTTKLVDYVPDEIGRFRYELYPPPTVEQAFPYLAYRTIQDMSDDEDTPPTGIPSHCLVHGAIADALRWGRRESEYYDPNTSAIYERMFEMDLANAAMADDSIYMTNLKWAFDAYEMKFGSDFWQSHDTDSIMGWI